MTTKPRARGLDGSHLWVPAPIVLEFVAAAILLFGLTGVALLMAFAPEQRTRVAVLSWLALTAALGWILLRRGHRAAAVSSMAVGAWTYATVNSWFGGGVEGTSIVFYPLIIILLGWLVGAPAAIGVAALSSVVTGGFVVAAREGWLPTAWQTPALVRWMVQVGTFTLTAAAIHFIVTSYRRRIEDVHVLTRHLRRAQGVAHVGSWTYDLERDDIELSDETSRIFGVPEGLHGTRASYLERVVDEDRAGLVHAWGEAVAGRQPFDYEHRIVVNGEPRWVRQIAEFERTADGTAIRVVGTTQDVTDRRRTEEALRAGEEELRCILGSTADGILAVDRSGRVLRTNARFLELWGLPPSLAEAGDDRALLKHVLDTLSDPEGFLRKVDALYASDATETGVIAFKDGRRFERFTAPLVVNGEPRGRVWSFRDITDRTRAERRLAMAMQITRLVSWEVDVVTGRVDCDPARLADLGIERPETLTTVSAWLARVHPDDRAEIERVAAAALAAPGATADCEYRMTNPSGTLAWLHSTARIVEWDAEERPLRGVGSTIDVTPRKRFEEARFQSRKLEALGTLAGGVAHDFNNILAAIRGNVDVLAHELAGNERVAESLDEMRKAISRSGELVRRIMAFGQPGDVKYESVDLASIVDEVLRLLRSALPAAIALRTDFAPDAPRALADAGHVHEVIVNLSTNAAYAIGDQPGTITYRLGAVTLDERQAAAVPGLEPGRYVRLSVSDTGCGMDAVRLGRIFDAFYTTKPLGKGTGLGLSVVHGIMKSHGGAVSAESAPGAGSTFSLYFQEAPPVFAPPLQVVAAPPTPDGARRVLYVDDEEAIVSVGVRGLTRLGHQVRGFTDPAAALAAFEQSPDEFDVVVTDLSMPLMSGIDLTRRILAVRADMPVILTTGWLPLEQERAALDAGVRQIVVKPVPTRDLSDTIGRCERRR